MFASMVLGIALLGAAVAGQAESVRGGGKSGTWTAYGGKVTMKKITTLADMARNKHRVAGKEIFTRGTATEVCQTKGCWMKVAEGEEELRVEFKDYGFFVPWGSEGKKVRMQGVLEERTLSREEQQHIAEESKRGPDEVIEGPKKVLVFVASVVEIQGGGALSSQQMEIIEGRKPEKPHDHHGHDHKHDHR